MEAPNSSWPVVSPLSDSQSVPERKSSDLLLKNKPDIMVILAWHLFDAISKKWRQKGLKKTNFVAPLPRLKISK